MNRWIFVRGILPAMLLILTARPGVAQGRPALDPSETHDASAAQGSPVPWHTTEVDTAGDTGQYVSIAIDPTFGYTVISYYDATYRDLRMAHEVLPGQGNCGERKDWRCVAVDSQGDVGTHNSIAIYGGYVSIAYHDATNRSLKYASGYYSAAGFNIITVDTSWDEDTTVGLYTSLGNYKGYSRISYYLDDAHGPDALMVAYERLTSGNCGGGGHDNWQCDIIDTGEGVGQHTALAMDGEGRRHVVYRDGSNGDLWYATNRVGTNCGPGGNTWTCYPVSVTDDVGQYASLYVDDAGRFHVAYYDATADALKYAVNIGGGGNCGILGSAQCDTIDSMPAGYHPVGISITEDAAGYPMIAYQSEYGDLKVARPIASPGVPAAGNCGPKNPSHTWHCETIDPAGTWVRYRNADYADIAVDSSGLATIAYCGFITSAKGNLAVAYQRLLQTFLPLLMK